MTWEQKYKRHLSNSSSVSSPVYSCPVDIASSSLSLCTSALSWAINYSAITKQTKIDIVYMERFSIDEHKISPRLVTTAAQQKNKKGKKQSNGALFENPK